MMEFHMRELTAVLVDDEDHCTETLRWMLENHCPDVEVVAEFNDPVAALKHLRDHPAEVVFLDIEMPVLNAFDLLDALGDKVRHVIFTTAYDEFAIKAIKHNALDYLLKPIDRDELMAAVEKLRRPPATTGIDDRLDGLLRQLRVRDHRDRLAVHTREGLEMVPHDQVVHARADDNYTELHLTDGKRILISRTLKDVERELPDDRFLRIHQSHLVAIDKVVRYVRGQGGYVVLSTGSEIPVSRARKDDLLRALGAE